MSTKSSRSIAAMIGSEGVREHGKAKSKARALAPIDGGAALAALDPHVGLGGVLSAKNVQAMLSKPKPTKAIAPAMIPAPAIIAPPPAQSVLKKKQQQKHGVTLREEDVMFTDEFDAQPPVAKKKSKAAAASTPAPAPAAPAASSSDAMEIDIEDGSQSQSLKKQKHRNFRASTAAASAATSSSASLPAGAPVDAFAPSARTLSKAERKKLEKLAQAKAKKAARKEVLSMLTASQMTPAQHQLLISSTHIGQKVTLKQQLRRQFVEQKAGILQADESDDDDVDRPKKIALVQTVSRTPLNKMQSLDFFASTISPHTKAPKAKPVLSPSLLPASNTSFADDFGSFRSSALSSTKRAGEGEDDAVGRGYIAGYIKAGKNNMQELEREMKEREEEEEDEDEEGEDDDEENEDDDDEEEDGEDDEDEDDDDSDAPAAPTSNLYSVAFDVKPIRANKKKRKRVALVIPGQEAKQKPEEEEENDENEEEEEKDEDTMDDGDDIVLLSSSGEEDEDEVPQPLTKKQKAAATAAIAAAAAAAATSSKKRKNAEPADDTPAADDQQPADEPTAAGPKLSRKAAKLANASVAVAKTFEAGKKFSRIKQDGPSLLYQRLAAARKEKGGEVTPYPGTEVLLSLRVSNNDQFLGDREEGKAVDKNKKKTKAAHEAALKGPLEALPPEARMPTLRQTPSGHIVVEVHRTEDIQAARMQLPLCSQEQEVMEAITENDIIIISGETGSGKTTQVPQFLFEAGYSLLSADKPGLIGITEPRRVAAISTAKRVAQELNVWNPEESKKFRRKQQQEKEKKEGKKAQAKASGAAATEEDDDPDVDMTLVSYQIRYTRLSTPSTRIKFMTDGILLREIQGSFLLPGYSAIIVDEAHERGINTDILIGLLSKIVPLRNKMAKKFLEEKARRVQELVARGRKKEDVDISDLTPIYPLKLIIMSATLRLNDFTQNAVLFPRPPPVLSVSARQYPVTTHFHKFTPLKDYMTHTLKMIMKMHAKLPRGADNSGGILVFMTGKEEIDILVRQLNTLFDEKRRREEAKKIKLTSALDDAMDEEDSGAAPSSSVSLDPATASARRLQAQFAATAAAAQKYDENDPNDPIFEIDVSDEEEEDEKKPKGKQNGKKSKKSKDDDETGDRFAEMDEGDDNAGDMEDAADGTSGDLGDESDSKNKMDPAMLQQQLKELADSATSPAYVLPLYSMLPTADQMKVFAPVPSAQHRLIVISTNVAETSLTIPGIKYVLDVGREKTRVYDRVTQTSQYVVQWISKASAAQRSGRSGRTGPGHAYRLYSSAVFDTQFLQFAPPEILRNPLESTILQMMSMSITDLPRFPFPTPPEQHALRLAFRSLELLGAVEPERTERKITELGRILSSFPVAPRFGKMLVLACNAGTGGAAQQALLSYMIRIVASLSVEQLWLVPSFHKKDEEDEEADENEQDTKDADSKKMQQLDPAASLARQHARAAVARKKEAKKRQQRLYNEAQARWRHPASDVLTMLRAIGGYEHVQAQSAKTDPTGAASSNDKARKLASHRCLAFLQANFLRIKAVEEILALKKQLQKIAIEMLTYNIEQQSPSSVAKTASKQQYDPAASIEEQEDSAGQPSSAVIPASSNSSAAVKPYLSLLSTLTSSTPLPPPSSAQETLLTQILCAGFIDHVARRMSPERKAGLMEDWQQKEKTEEEEEEGFNLDGAYECLATQEPVFIHPSSLLFAPENQPDYLVYAELVKTKKLYMRCNTVLPHIAWLEKYGAHLVTYSAPIQANPSPIYDPVNDEVLAYRDVVFGPNRWDLPRSTSPFPIGLDRTKHFLRLFLSGVVCTQLKQFLPYLLFKPHSLTSTDVTGALNKNLTRLIACFVQERIDSRAKLEAKWTQEPTFFLQEYLTWIQPSQHATIKKLWPPREKSTAGSSSSSKKK